MDIKQFIRIKLKSDHADEIRLAKKLAAELGLDTPSANPGNVPFHLSFVNRRLELTENFKDKNDKSPIFVDFLNGSIRYRYKYDRRINQLITKAVGIKKGIRPTICDTTAGYGSDSFIFASFGCVVTMIERSPVIWALLSDGLRRAAEDREIGQMIVENLSLHRGDSITLLKKMGKNFDTIYMDPMYPLKKKSALNKQKMRVLRSLVGDDVDHRELLQTSLAHATGRVVVKRPSTAAKIEGVEPSYQVKGKSSRYDIYLSSHL